MAEHPILFNSEMVRAILDGRKSQTRRVIKSRVLGNPAGFNGGNIRCLTPESVDGPLWQQYGAGGVWLPLGCPYGQPGDTLWVREAWRPWPHPDLWDGVMYRADNAFTKPEGLTNDQGFWMSGQCESIDERWRPSIHMPRWACRIELEVTEVRVERVQDISDDGAVAEGIKGQNRFGSWANYGSGLPKYIKTPQDSFATLWDFINAKRGYGWDVNPWVWVVTFNRKDPHNA
jgi:hypothetical protein